jgi:hypothetical protein
MSKIKFKNSLDSPSKPTKRYYKFSSLSLHSGMFKDVKSFEINEEITLEVKVKITSLRLADNWEQTEYKGITKDTQFANAEVISVKKSK